MNNLRMRNIVKNISEEDKRQLKLDKIEYNEDGNVIWCGQVTEDDTLNEVLSFQQVDYDKITGDGFFLLYRDYYNCDFNVLVERFNGKLTHQQILYTIKNHTLKTRYIKEFIELRKHEMLNRLEQNAVDQGDPNDIDKYNEYMDDYYDTLDSE